MTYLGNDNSVLSIALNGDQRVYYSTAEDGIKLQDIYPNMSYCEAMWVHDLRHCGIEAIDIWRIATTAPIHERELIIEELYRDIERYNELERNIRELTHFTLFESPSNFMLISKSQKHLNQLRTSITERKMYFEDYVYYPIGKQYRDAFHKGMPHHKDEAV